MKGSLEIEFLRELPLIYFLLRCDRHGILVSGAECSGLPVTTHSHVIFSCDENLEGILPWLPSALQLGCPPQWLTPHSGADSTLLGEPSGSTCWLPQEEGPRQRIGGPGSFPSRAFLGLLPAVTG